LVDSSNVTSGQMSATHASNGVFVSHAVTELHVQLQLLLLNACLKRFWSTLPACSACKCRPFLHMSHIASSAHNYFYSRRSPLPFRDLTLRAPLPHLHHRTLPRPLRSAPLTRFSTRSAPISAPLSDAQRGRGGAYGSVCSVPGQSSTVSVDPMSCSLAGTNNIKIHFKNIKTTGYAEPNATKTSPLK